MSVKIKKLWPIVGKSCMLQEPLLGIRVVFPRGRDLSFLAVPATGRVVVELEGGFLVRVTIFDEGPSRRDVKNSRWKK